MDGWDNFFVAQAGAAAAFAGLVLVSISINLDKIIKGRGLTGRSAEPLVVLFTLFICASFMLIPKQATWVYGIEILVMGVLFAIVIGAALIAQHRILYARDNPTPPPRFSLLIRVLLCAITAASLIAAGGLIAFEHERGVFMLVPAMIAGFLLAFLDAWVLLIEIDR